VTTVFLDCETLGLDRAAPIWEFAAIRIADDGTEVNREHFTIRHEPAKWMATLPDEFVRDYHARYVPGSAASKWDAARRIASIVAGGAVIAGSNPAFDMERLEDLLSTEGLSPGWHYHPCDVPTMAIGYLAARGELIPRPWKSDALSAAVGILPIAYRRHTAMGDVLWTRDLYEAITGGVW
jgi:hypothetical protein